MAALIYCPALENQESFRQHAAHSRGFGLFGNGIFEVVHVGDGRHASANLLRRGQPRAPADKFFRHIFGFRREDVFPQPLVERHVVTNREATSSARVCAIDETSSTSFLWHLCLRGGDFASMFARDPTATIASPSTATAPSSMMGVLHSS